MAQHKKLLLGLLLGLILGLALHPYHQTEWLKDLNESFLQPVGQIFLRLIFMVVVPLVVSALILGVYELGKRHGLGSVASKTLFYAGLMSSLSVVIGITLVNVFQPGAGIEINPEQLQSQSAAISSVQKSVAETPTVSQALINLIPRNPLDSATRALDGEMLPLMVFALIFGAAISRVARDMDRPPALMQLCEEVLAASMKVVGFAMRLAPYGVFTIVFNTVFKLGGEILVTLMYYVLIVVGAILLQQFAVYAPLLKFLTGRPPMRFFKECQHVYLYAFSTASSNATLPLALETAETTLKLPPHISRFVLTVGSTANQNGTALFEGITVLFLAQVYGIELALSKQILVVVMSILAGIGTAGVPGGSLPLIALLLQSLGVPPEGLGLILGVDRFLDMCRTTLNVSGDLVISALVSGRVAEEEQRVLEG
jgi:DAACS family dicarboxylate/amino acid:cation (Na+ or H+) symporter